MQEGKFMEKKETCKEHFEVQSRGKKIYCTWRCEKGVKILRKFGDDEAVDG